MISASLKQHLIHIWVEMLEIGVRAARLDLGQSLNAVFECKAERF